MDCRGMDYSSVISNLLGIRVSQSVVYIDGSSESVER